VFALTLPDGLLETVRMVHGPKGQRWYDDLPRLVETCRARWSLHFEEVLKGGVLSCCISAQMESGERVVLKIPSSSDLYRREETALAAWRGHGAPRLLDTDDEICAMVMTRIVPGTTIGLSHSLDDSVRIMALIGKLLRTGDAEPMSSVQTHVANLATRFAWATERFAPAEWSLERSWLAAARRQADELLESESRTCLLHGDLQTKNILLGEDGAWVAIDPLPCIGEVEYDAAFWAVMQDSPVGILERVREVSDGLRLQADRAHQWARVLSIVEQRPWDAELYSRLRSFAESSFKS